MKSIIGIIGSPRKLGNCEIMAKEIARATPEPHEFRMEQKAQLKDIVTDYRKDGVWMKPPA